MRLLLWLLWSSYACHLTQSRVLSRPDLEPLPLTIHTNELPLDDNDLIFVTPFWSTQDGAAIYSPRGELVWDGHELSSSNYHSRAHNLRPIHFRGSAHLTYTTIQDDKSGTRQCAHKVLNSSYAVVAEFSTLDSGLTLDAHEFEVLDGGKRYIQAATLSRPAKNGTRRGLVESAIQEIDASTREVVLEWRSLDHVPFDQACVVVSDVADYFHLNSLQKDSQDNYLINGYNVCSTYYINGSTGDIIWSLGGANSSFEVRDDDDGDYKLAFMHHVRVQPLSLVHLPVALKKEVTNTTHLALSLFDNAFSATDSPPTSPSSSGLILLLDLRTRMAKVVERFPHPQGKIAAMFGSLSLQPNGERFIGWGSARDMSQHTRDGRIVFHAELGDDDSLIGSFRTFKAPWVGMPLGEPSVYVYARGCGWKNAVYVSWNGATEVVSYKVFGSMERQARYFQVANGPKDGFETTLRTDRFVEFAFVEAMDVRGLVLGRSSVVRTYVPLPVESRGCSEWKCPATLSPRSLPRYDCSSEGYIHAAFAGDDGQILLR